MTPQLLSHYPAHPPPAAGVRLAVLPPHDCPYLPGRPSVSRAFLAAGQMPPGAYHRFMDAGFRRSGRLVYQPVCPGCRACIPLRVPVASFVASKSQRRCWRKNQDLLVTSGRAVPTDEKFDLYRRYATQWHGKPDADEGYDAFEAFLYDSPVDTVEFCYRDADPAAGGRLLAVGICDVCPRRSLSSVYFYHDPADSRRGLGTFGALYEIAAARQLHIPHYYLGYWVAGCRTMEYKSNFAPCEVLSTDGVWRPLAAPTPRPPAAATPRPPGEATSHPPAEATPLPPTDPPLPPARPIPSPEVPAEG